MTLTFKYDAPLDDYYIIPAGTKVEMKGIENGFMIIRYKDKDLLFNEGYFDL